jgi:hypothetical protein
MRLHSRFQHLSHRHERYGIARFERHAHVVRTLSGPIQEVPIATVRLAGGWIAPIGGDGYLRMLPYRYTAAGIRRVNQSERQPACIYFHPGKSIPDKPASQRTASRVYELLRDLRDAPETGALTPGI